MPMKDDKDKNFIINLNRAKSKRALAAAIVLLSCTFPAVVREAIKMSDIESSFHYFTTLSNLLSACGAMFMLPYAVEGVRKKRFTMPRWITLFQYTGAVSVFITLFCAVTIISFTMGPAYTFGGNNFWLHLISPTMAIVLFLAVETDHKIARKDTAISLIPFWAYGVLYFIMVVLIGKSRGGWADLYNATSILPIWVAFGILFVIGYAAAIFLRKIHNHSVDRNLEKLSYRWDGLSSVELRVEALGLGRYMAEHLDKSEIVIPMDIFELMSRKCDVTVSELTQAYIKGVEQGLNG